MNENEEMYEVREKEILEELGRLKMDDPARKQLINELDTLSSIRVNYSQAEQNRLNNNARNDIDEARLIIEEEKVKNDKKRNIAMLIQTISSLALGSFLYAKSYHMDEDKWAYKDLKNYSLRLIEKIKGK